MNIIMRIARWTALVLLLGMIGTVQAQAALSLLFSSDQDGNREIYSMNIDGSSLTRLTTDPGEDIDPARSPDGSQIAFASNRDGNFAIYLMNANGSSVRRLTTDIMGSYISSPAWSPDGQSLAFVSNASGNNQIHAVNVDGTNFRRLTETNNEAIDPSWSPNGQQIAFSSNTNGNFEVYSVSYFGGNPQQLSNDPSVDSDSPAWSPDGTQIAYAANSRGGEIVVMGANGASPRPLSGSGDGFASSPTWSPDGQTVVYVLRNSGERASLWSIDINGNGLRRLTDGVNESNYVSWAAPTPISGFSGGGGGEVVGTMMSYGSSVDDYLSSSSSGDRWQFQGSNGDSITIQLNSPDFDTYLELLDPGGYEMSRNDDSNGSLNSQIGPLRLTQTGSYTIIARGFSPTASGDYTLSLDNNSSGSGGGAVTPGSLDYGDSVSGMMISSNRDRWTFYGNTNDIVQINLNSSAFDPYLELLSPSGSTLATNDDSNGLNSQIVYTLPESGTYTIIARPLSSGNGSYELSLRTNGQEVTQTIEIGQSLSGRLVLGSRDRWTFYGNSNNTIQINLNSSAFDAYLELISPSGSTLATNDDSNGLNSQIIYTLTQSGTYTIIARPLSSGSGNYTLSLQSYIPPATATPGVTQTIEIGQSLSGRLVSGSRDRWTFYGNSNNTIQINLNSSAFDAYLELISPNGSTLATNDDGGGSLNSQIVYTLTQSGTYTIIARAFSSGGGNYTLSLQSYIPPATATPIVAQTIEYGQSRSGRLVSGTVDHYQFTGRVGDNITITLNSPDFDTYLELLDPSGFVLSRNDDANGSLNSQIGPIRLTSAGTYTIVARGFSQSASGSYTLHISH